MSLFSWFWHAFIWLVIRIFLGMKCEALYLLQALNVLSVLAAIRLDEKTDKIENILYSTLLDRSISKARSIDVSTDLLSSSTWEEVL